MKRFRVLAALICSMMVLTSLSACTGNNGKPAEESSVTAADTVETSSSEEPTGESSEVSETEAPDQGEVIPLWNPVTVNGTEVTINQLLVKDSLNDMFSKGFLLGVSHYWPFAGTDRKVDDSTLYQLTMPWNIQELIVTDKDGNNPVEVNFYFYGDEGESTTTYIEAGEASEKTTFLPVWYDSSKKCVVGYYRSGGVWDLVELYWDSNAGYSSTKLVEDPSVYGL